MIIGPTTSTTAWNASAATYAWPNASSTAPSTIWNASTAAASAKACSSNEPKNVPPPSKPNGRKLSNRVSPKPINPRKSPPKPNPPLQPNPPNSSSKAKTTPKNAVKSPFSEQWVEVSIQENGETLTRLFSSNKNLIERGKAMLPPPELVYRRLNFPHGVPPEYEWVNSKEEKRKLGGCGIQRMTTDTWLEVIAREAPEFERPGYRSSFAPEHIGPTGVGNLPRPKERGGCDCHVCTKNQEILDRQAIA